MNPYRRIFMKRAGLCGMGAALYLAGCGGDSEPAAKDTAKAVAARMNAETCTDCGACVEVCPTDAIAPGE